MVIGALKTRDFTFKFFGNTDVEKPWAVQNGFVWNLAMLDNLICYQIIEGKLFKI